MREETRKTVAIVFVYNAGSGLFDAVADLAHKAISPKTYQCNLCALTHSSFGMRKSWQEFLNGLEIEFELLHADELKDRYSIQDIPLPAIFKKHDERLTILVDSDSINRCGTLTELKVLVTGKLNELTRGAQR